MILKFKEFLKESNSEDEDFAKQFLIIYEKARKKCQKNFDVELKTSSLSLNDYIQNLQKFQATKEIAENDEEIFTAKVAKELNEMFKKLFKGYNGQLVNWPQGIFFAKATFDDKNRVPREIGCNFFISLDFEKIVIQSFRRTTFPKGQTQKDVYITEYPLKISRELRGIASGKKTGII